MDPVNASNTPASLSLEAEVSQPSFTLAKAATGGRNTASFTAKLDRVTAGTTTVAVAPAARGHHARSTVPTGTYCW